MYLKRLEISGFKSFANKSTLEFKKGVSAIVGPNGSGKSNVADAIRWVMGEQGMKALRSKKSEDLIFSGSAKKSAIGKASVALYFDNSDRVFPMEFEEIGITRKVFRDGEVQYFVNDAQVRLKDIIELIAKAKLGLRGYTIINQGMGDAILNASPKERREILEDALGLKEFQIKKTEAKNKLALTTTNLAQTKSLIAEIVPHLKFLNKQVEKIQQKEVLEKNLVDAEKRYFGIKLSSLNKEKIGLLKTKEDIEKSINNERDLIDQLKSAIKGDEERMESFFGQESSLEKELEELASKKGQIERELGKIEGVLAYKKQMPLPQTEKYELINLPYLNTQLKNIHRNLKEILRSDSLDALKKGLDSLMEQFDKLMEEAESGKIKKPVSHEIKIEEKESDNNAEKMLFEEKAKFAELLKDLDEKIRQIREEARALNVSHREEKDKLYNSKRDLYEKELRYDKLKQQAQNFDFQINRILSELELIKQESKAAENFDETVFTDLPHIESHDLDLLKQDIERIKLKLEMMENIDPEIQKERDETQKRHDFLVNQSDDLNNALSSLSEVIVSLENKIETMFDEAFVKINEEFDKYFKILFEGGKANLAKINKPTETEILLASAESQEDGEIEKDPVQEGIEIKVDMPRKKVRDLHMLSGGERALTSMAIIFALVSCSQPPFLVLDEIDAPLDESNALRFGKILEELRSKTQFVIITHNRETMKQADILYGVTMSDDGISQLFSLKLDEIGAKA